MNKLMNRMVIVAILLCSFNTLQAQLKPAQSQAELQAKDAAFLKKNKTQPGVTVTASGLQYKVLKMGKGPIPKKLNRVTINYTLKNFDGKIVGSNGNQVWNHRMDKSLYGMEEALKMMPQRSKWVLYMPVNLCKSKYETIAGGRALECTIELLEVQ